VGEPWGKGGALEVIWNRQPANTALFWCPHLVHACLSWAYSSLFLIPPREAPFLPYTAIAKLSFAFCILIPDLWISISLAPHFLRAFRRDGR